MTDEQANMYSSFNKQKLSTQTTTNQACHLVFFKLFARSKMYCDFCKNLSKICNNFETIESSYFKKKLMKI